MLSPVTWIGPFWCLRLGVRSDTNKVLPSTVKVKLRNTVPCCISRLTLIKLTHCGHFLIAKHEGGFWEPWYCLQFPHPPFLSCYQMTCIIALGNKTSNMLSNPQLWFDQADNCVCYNYCDIYSCMWVLIGSFFMFCNF